MPSILLMRLIVLINLILFWNFSQAQNHIISGSVCDAQTKKPLAFVNITVNDGKTGVASDIDGKFHISSHEPINQLNFSYLGYERKTLDITTVNKVLEVLLKPLPVNLGEVVILPGLNPAHRIIDSVLANRNYNDPKKLSSYAYTAYEKMIFTIDADSLMQADTASLDTSELKLRKFFDERDLFLVENITKKIYMRPERAYEKVMATKVSGFKDPIFVFLMSQMQSTSFYDEVIQIMDAHYINPIAAGATKKYFFNLVDTLLTRELDTVFIIQFQPAKGTNFDGMKGVLSINSSAWAIQNVVAEPAEPNAQGFRIKIQQLYEQIDNQWFPVQLNMEIFLEMAQVSNGEDSFGMLGQGKRYLKNIELNPELVKKQFNELALEVDPEAMYRDEEYWNAYRVDSLTKKNLETYRFIDSLGQEANFDRMAQSFDALLRGKLPIGIFDVDLSKIFRYNSYEGVYLGLGLSTNDRLSEKISLGGFWGYGFGDNTAKYGADVNWLMNKRRDMRFRLAYAFQAVESAGSPFFTDTDFQLNPENFRSFLIERMNLTEYFRADISFHALQHFRWMLGLERASKQAFEEYVFMGDTGPQTQFELMKIRLGVRFAFREKFLMTTKGRVSLGTDYPIFTLQYTRGLDPFWQGAFDFDRFDIRFDYSRYFKYVGESSLRLNIGKIWGELPYPELYNGHGSFRPFTIFAPFSFATMRMNEFLSDEYLAVYFTHNFGKLLRSANGFSPDFMLAFHSLIGSYLGSKNIHENISFQTPENGFFEAGLLLNDLLNLRVYNLGLGVFYRFGAYNLPETSDNFAYKFSLYFPF